MNDSNWLRRMDEALSRKAALAPGILRCALGLVFLGHAYAKLALFTLPGTAQFFEAHGFPGWAAYPVFAVELLGGVRLLVGIHVRLVAAMLIPVMLGALVPHWNNGWMFTNPGGGWEYVAFLSAALFSQLLLGRGSWSVASPSATESGQHGAEKRIGSPFNDAGVNEGHTVTEGY
jgi:putative oxidoreductase